MQTLFVYIFFEQSSIFNLILGNKKYSHKIHEKNKRFFWCNIQGDPEVTEIYTANHATFPKQIRKITVQICCKFWVKQ